MTKQVTVIGHRFDALPGHVMVTGRGEGGTLRAALCDAVRAMLANPRLKRKRLGSFSIAVTVLPTGEKENP